MDDVLYTYNLYVPQRMARALLRRYAEHLRELVESGEIVRVVVV